MIDMPTVFDLVNRIKLMDYIGEILSESELYMINI